jgi:hypothetical protein
MIISPRVPCGASTSCPSPCSSPLLAAGTLAGDYLLHRLDLVWVGRYLGIPGTLLIIASLVYSLAQTQGHRQRVTRNPCYVCTKSGVGSAPSWC